MGEVKEYIHLFETENEYNTVRNDDYLEPWVSLTKKSDGDVNSFIGEVNGPTTIDRQFNYFGFFGNETFIDRDVIESNITAVDIENNTITVDGYVFSFGDTGNGNFYFNYSGQTQTTGTVERTWIEEIQDGKLTHQISACTVNDTTFGMRNHDGEQYYWIEVDFATMTTGSKSFIVDHELQVNESVTITEILDFTGFSTVEPEVGVLFKYIKNAEQAMWFYSENGRKVKIGDTYDGITVKTIVEAEEGENINKVNYNKTEEEIKFSTPLTFEIQSDGNIIVDISNKNLMYKKNDGEWIVINPESESELSESELEVEIPVVNGDMVQFKGNNNNIGYPIFHTTCQFAVKGNIMSLINFSKLTSDAFRMLFRGCTGLTNASELLLPATTLAYGCYNSMFKGCTSLTTAPELPATTLAESCYYEMFSGCTSLTTAPELPATTLAESCYYGMFQGCTSLTTAPQLPATTLVNFCYTDMFQGCTSLTTAPQLPATTLAQSCYVSMFKGCINLTQAPELPATNLANQCYEEMFYGCTSLTTAPELPATTVAAYCYRYMFNGCTGLTTAPSILPARTLAQSCYWCMFSNCTSLTTAPLLPATTLVMSCYNQMFSGCSNLNYIKCLATDISATSCTYNWVSGVAASGTFVKAASMTGWPRGTSGIPNGWTVQDNTLVLG